MTMHLHTSQELEHALRQSCSGGVFFDTTARGIYATDASIYQVMPIAVLQPDSPDDAVRAITVLAHHRTPMLPRGGGTSLAGQCVNDAVVIDLSSGCTDLIELDASARTCTVQSGITIDDLNDRIAHAGLFFAPDPSTARQANIGGCIGNNAAGMHSILYGRTSENVLAIDSCLWDGTRLRFDEGAAALDSRVRTITDSVLDIVEQHADLIRKRFPKTMRRSAGYQLDVLLGQLDRFGRDYQRINLAPLLCGSEGTLVFTLNAQLLLHPCPRAKGLAVMSFATIEEAIAAVGPILELEPSAVELLDRMILDLARSNTVCRPYTDLLPETATGEVPSAVLYVEFFSDKDDEDVRTKIERLHVLFPDNPLKSYTDPAAMNDAWTLRKSGEPLLHAIPGDRKPLGFIEDNAVPVENLSAFVAGLREIIDSEETTASYYAHASVGVLHVRPLLNLRDPADERRMFRIAQRAAALAKSLGGVPSGEHGDGRARGPLLESYFGAQLMDAFRQIKAVFDPHNLMNPGNIVHPGVIESIAQSTRIRPDATTVQFPEVETYYTFDGQGGFGHAVEMCNGAGVCRKKSIGTMCPSYHATLDERHSTRGRANALRLAITGQTSPLTEANSKAAWADQGAKEILDLCLSCKACKSECPSNVDIAKLKGEYLAQSYASSGRTPMRARIMSRVHTINRLGSAFPKLTNTLNRFPPARSLLNHTLGLHPARSLPVFSSAHHDVPIPETGSPKILILSDTFSTHNEPGITAATLRVLRAFGYATGVKRVSDLGRSAISQGCLPHAIRDAQKMLDELAPFINDESIVAFVIPEPSCVSAVLDDWRELQLDREQGMLDRLFSRVALPEAFLDARWDAHPVRPVFKNPDGKLRIHGHCHQKALWGEQSAAGIFRRLFPAETELLDTGCCGMAGAFGYSAHRYDLSMKIGEQRLFPAVRNGADQDIIVASGTSCRHQILDGTSKQSYHAIEVLDQLLAQTGEVTR